MPVPALRQDPRLRWSREPRTEIRVRPSVTPPFDLQRLDAFSVSAMLSADASISGQLRWSPRRPPSAWKNNREVNGHWSHSIAPTKTL
jgi:hypothetical protein